MPCAGSFAEFHADSFAISGFARDQRSHHLSEEDDRSPGDFHSTGASDVPRQDSRGTKPARAILSWWPERAISRVATHHERNTIATERPDEMRQEGSRR